MNYVGYPQPGYQGGQPCYQGYPPPPQPQVFVAQTPPPPPPAPAHEPPAKKSGGGGAAGGGFLAWYVFVSTKSQYIVYNKLVFLGRKKKVGYCLFNDNYNIKIQNRSRLM